MKVSVIIPTYNRAELLKRAISSVLVQSYMGFELIVVDDGSEDHTRSILKNIHDPRLKVICQTHRGVSSARNTGILNSSGEIVALLDSDDEWMGDKLEKHLQFHIQGNWHISQTDEIWIRKGRRVNPGKRHAKKAGWIFEPSLELCLVSPSCVMFTRDFFHDIGPFDEDFPACEDYDMWLRASLKYPVGLCPYPLVVRHGGREDQLSSKIIGLDLYRIYSLIKLLKNPYMDSYKEKLVKNTLKIKANTYIKGCLKRGKLEEAKRIKEMVEMWMV